MVTGSTPVGNVDLDLDAAEEWISLLHGASDGFVHVCSTQSWTGKAFPITSMELIKSYISWLDGQGAKGIYLRLTTIKDANLSPGQRGSVEDSHTLPGFWADLDIAGPGHKTNKPLPPNEDEARRIVAESGLPEPSIWMHSGGGMYAWWLLHNPVEVTDGQARDSTQDFSTRWQDVLTVTAERIGYSYGGLGDLSRVTRIPGTVNRKIEDAPTRCRMLPSSARLYSSEDLAKALRDAEVQAVRLAPKPVVQTSPKIPMPRPAGDDGGRRPGDDLADQMSWEEILSPAGYQFDRNQGEETYWVRPGKNRRDGHSCTTNYRGSNLMFVFSTEMDGFEANRTYSKFATWAALNGYGSDFKAASKALRSQGYGSQRQPATPPQPFQPRQAADGGSAPGEPGEAVVEHEHPLPDVDVTNSSLGMVAVMNVINKGLIPSLYVRDGELVEITEIAGHYDETDDYKPIGIKVVTADALVRILNESARVYKVVKAGKDDWKEVPTAIPGTTARAVLSASNWTGVPVLRDIVEAPVLRADGTLLQTPGYDPASKLYYHPRVRMDQVSENPSEGEVAEARDFLLDKVLGDFPWASQADRANYVALLMTPIMRPYIGGLVPLGAVSATERGSGKTLLTDIIGRLYGSVSRPWVPGDEELRKSITTILMGEAAPVVVFDNVGDGERVEAATLAKLLTSRRWDDRALGTNKAFSGQNDRMWMVTGNNIALGGDIASRTVLVSIDPKMPRPELRRNFQLGDLEEWLDSPDNRARLLHCLLVLARSWIAEGAPKADFTMRGFSHWAKALGGLVSFHGLTGFLGNESELSDSDADADEWTGFFQAWHERYGERPQTAAGLITESKSLMFNDAWREQLPSDTSKGMGMLLKARRGRHYSGFVLKGRRDNHRKVWEWWVAPVGVEAAVQGELLPLGSG